MSPGGGRLDYGPEDDIVDKVKGEPKDQEDGEMDDSDEGQVSVCSSFGLFSIHSISFFSFVLRLFCAFSFTCSAFVQESGMPGLFLFSLFCVCASFHMLLSGLG